MFGAKDKNLSSQDESTDEDSVTENNNTAQQHSQFVNNDVDDQLQSTSILCNIDETHTPTIEHDQYPLNDNLLSLGL